MSEIDRQLIKFVIDSSHKKEEEYDENTQFQINQINVFLNQLTLNVEISASQNETLIVIIEQLFQNIYQLMQQSPLEIDLDKQVVVKLRKQQIKAFQYKMALINIMKQVKYNILNIVNLEIEISDERLGRQIQSDWFAIYSDSLIQTFCCLKRDSDQIDVILKVQDVDGQVELTIKQLDQSYLYMNQFSDLESFQFQKLSKHDHHVNSIVLKLKPQQQQLQMLNYDDKFVQLMDNKYQQYKQKQQEVKEDDQNSISKQLMKQSMILQETEIRPNLLARHSKTVGHTTNGQSLTNSIENVANMIKLVRQRISVHSMSQNWKQTQKKKLMKQLHNQWIDGSYQSVGSKHKYKIKLMVDKIEFKITFNDQERKNIVFYSYQISEIKQESNTLHFKVNKMQEFRLLFQTEQQTEYVLGSYENVKGVKVENDSLFERHKIVYGWLVDQSAQKVQVDMEKNYVFYVVIRSRKPKSQKILVNIDKNILIFKNSDDQIIKMLDLQTVKRVEHDYRSLISLKLKMSGQQKYKIEFSNANNLNLFKKLVLEYKMKKKKVESQGLRVWVSTYNCGESKPSKALYEEPNSWLFDTDKYDVIVIGLQECNTTKWNIFLQKKYKQHKLVSIQAMWKMMVLVLIKYPVCELVSNVQTAHLATGIAKMIGNKGGVAISFRILNSSFMFLSCHLAARPSRLDIRIQNYLELVSKIKLGNPGIQSISQFDYVFFIGDMNFRIDQEFKQVEQLCCEQKYKEILKYDQLLKSKQSNKLFGEFQEQQITFRPTYRRIKNSDEFSNKKEQSPSYTDRILFRNNRNHKLEIEEYNSKEHQYGSDHRPVYAIFKLEFRLPSLNTELYFKAKPSQLFRIQIELLILDLETDQELVQESQLSVTFCSQILNNIVSSEKQNYARNRPLKWKQSQIPALDIIAIEMQQLKAETIDLVYSIDNQYFGSSQIVIGSVLDQMEGCFYDKVKYQGNYYGNLFGKLQLNQQTSTNHK